MIFFLIFIFLHFRVQLDLLTHLAKFQSITNIRSHFILTFISENLRPPLINLCSKAWLQMGESDVKDSNIPHGLKL